MNTSQIVKLMEEQLRLTFWDFRCYFMHDGGNSIPFDLAFFKLAKASDILFGDERAVNSGYLYSFQDAELNRNLTSTTAEEHKWKTLIMQFFFLRKEFAKIKQGLKPLDFPFHLNILMEIARSYGGIEQLEAMKREVTWNLSSDMRVLMVGRAYPSLGNEFQTAFSTVRKFARPKKRDRDQFTTYLVTLFKDFKKANGRYPRNKEVERLLEQAQGHGFIHFIDDEIEWGQSGRTKMSSLQNRLTEIRKILT